MGVVHEEQFNMRVACSQLTADLWRHIGVS
jgi:hypothetical protein